MERIIVLLGLILAVQTSWARDPITDEKFTQIIDQFQYITRYTETKTKSHSSGWDACWIYSKEIETDYPGMVDPLMVTVQFYIPNRDDLKGKEVPMVVMFPPLGGTNSLDEKMAETFCAKDMAAFIITNDFTGVQSGAVPPVDDHDYAFHRTIAGLKAAMAFAEDDENINGEKIGVFGVSLGGIIGAFAMETQINVSVGYFVVAGGDVPHILAQSDQKDVRRIRVARMKEENLSTRDEYEDFLRVHLTLDPFDLAKALPPETINMVIAKQDSTVPTQDQIDLHAALGSPDVTYVNGSHVDAVISTLFWGSGRRGVAKFFTKRFALENPRLTRSWLDQFELSRFYAL